MKKNIKNIIVLMSSIFAMASCTEVLDKDNLQVFGGDEVWTLESMTSAYLNDIYATLMPGWSYTGYDSDEGTNSVQNLNDFLRGTATIDSYDNWRYDVVERINLFLSKIEETPYSQEKIDHYKGQALFWRAWAYFSMVKNYGGVPLILDVQDYKNPDGLFVRRNKTSECFSQIVKDLDDAVSLLPDAFAGSNYGRIDKGIALAFKGRVLLTYASPLFNPSSDANLWQTAYNANKEAKDFLESKGKGLYGSFRNIWYDERNKEVVMVNQFYAPEHYSSQAAIRPLFLSKDAFGANQPTLHLVNAFPMKNGSDFDPSIPLAYDTLFKYRDDRFYATLAYNGCDYITPDFKPGEKLWTGYTSDGTSLLIVIHHEPGVPGRTGFWQMKALDTSLDKTNVHYGKVDWIEMRFAEVLMNYGEAANEIGKTSEALQVLYDIRERAGILPGANSQYGVMAETKSEIRETYIKERFVEFAFENKRWNDLRRWRRFDILNDQGTRKAVQMWLKPGEQVPLITDDINNQSVWSRFTPKIIENIEGTYTFNVQDKYYFYAIPKGHLDKNPNLEQNQAWGGTFNPLE